MYKIKKPKKLRRPKQPENRVEVSKEEEQLTGIVMGWEASDIEERFARGLGKHNYVERYSFRDHYFGPARNVPGAVEVDFMVFSEGWWPIQIDGAYAHKTVAQKDRDKENDARINEHLSKFGVNPVQRIPDSARFLTGCLDTQESADQTVRDLFR